MVDNLILKLINTNAIEFRLQPSIVYGVCKKESMFDQFAIRYELRYRYTINAHQLKPSICSATTELVLQKCSIGLMQVMGAVYREYGYSGWLSGLFINAETQLFYGCKHLSSKIDKYGLEKGIASYNSGTPIYKKGELINQRYVDDVLLYSKEYKSGT